MKFIKCSERLPEFGKIAIWKHYKKYEISESNYIIGQLDRHNRIKRDNGKFLVLEAFELWAELPEVEE